MNDGPDKHMKPITTAFAVRNDEEDGLMTGEEDYPILGGRLRKGEKRKVLDAFKGLSLTYHCESKTQIAYNLVGREREYEMVMGGLMVISEDFRSSYGHYYNPPSEFHMWLEHKDGNIIDFALPGVIIKGLKTRDHVGPCLVGRSPYILAGRKSNWLLYEKKVIVCVVTREMDAIYTENH